MNTLPNIKAYDGKDNYIFVSYSHKDKSAIYPIIEVLQKEYNVWFDEGIHYGNEWEEEIAEKLENCSLFIYMLTKESLESENCKDELHHARTLKKNFINVMTEKEIELPRWFKLRYSRFQMCNLFLFSSPESAIEDLKRKCEWLDSVKRTKIEIETNTGYEKAVASTKRKMDEKVRSEVEIKQNDKLKKKTTREVEERETHTNIGDIITFGRYVQHKNGPPEPIKWQVLAREGDTALIISKYALDCQQYNSYFKEITWESCSLRTWLNTTFLDSAFSKKEQELIIKSEVSADNNPSISTPPGNNTIDKVFLLSVAEANKYFSSDESRKCEPTDYTIERGALISDTQKTDEKATCWWWLRTPGHFSFYASRVRKNGSINFKGSLVDRKVVAIRPALWINLHS